MTKKTEKQSHVVDSGQGKKDLYTNCLKALNTEVRFNDRSNKYEYRKDGKDWFPATDMYESSLRSEIELRCWIEEEPKKEGDQPTYKKVKPSKQGWDDIIDPIAYENVIDPFKVWLDKLPEWDNVERLPNMLSDLFGVEKTPLTIHAIKSVMMGAVMRADKPGAKFDHMVILVGSEGIGKSTFWSKLLPDKEWFSDNLNLNADDKYKVECLMGKVLVECGELRGSTRAEVDGIKAFLSRDEDHIRLAYARRPQGLKRRCVIVGTSNDESCLPNDPGGNRRFIPIMVNAVQENNRKHVVDYIKSNREQIWAEAKVRYANNEPCHITADLKEEHRGLVEQHRHSNQVLEEKLGRLIEDNLGEQLTYVEIYDKINIKDPHAGLQKQTREILKQMGAEFKKVNIKLVDGGYTSQKKWHMPGTRPARKPATMYNRASAEINKNVRPI